MMVEQLCIKLIFTEILESMHMTDEFAANANVTPSQWPYLRRIRECLHRVFYRFGSFVVDNELGKSKVIPISNIPRP